MTADATKKAPTLSAWAQLVRLPNVFTVIADVAAAYLLLGGGPDPIARLVLVVIAGIALYWAGMILNDVFDLPRDLEERPTRPLPANHISLGKAKAAGWILLVLGIAVAAASGQVSASENVAATWMPAVIAALLAILIVAYDGPLKKTLLAPAAMGGCRVLSFLLGAAPHVSIAAFFPKYVTAIAIGFGVYIMGITLMARREAVGGPSVNLPSGLVVMIIGCALLAFAPQIADPAKQQWRMSTSSAFPLLIGLICFPVILRGIRAVSDPDPRAIQLTVKAGILGIIPLAAAFAFLGAGQIWGFAIIALVIPSLILSAKFRVT